LKKLEQRLLLSNLNAIIKNAGDGVLLIYKSEVSYGIDTCINSDGLQSLQLSAA